MQNVETLFRYKPQLILASLKLNFGLKYGN